MTGKLTKQDLERLLTDPSAENRADLAAKIADEYQGGDLGDDERKIVIEIFLIMVEDAEARVRAALSEHLKESGEIPRELALRFAHDEDIVAAPILRSSDLLTDDDLIEIVRSSGEAKQSAIAERKTISERVTDTLVEHGSPSVVSRVMENPGARVSEATYGRVLDVFGASSEVGSAMVRRALLPVSVAERLVALAAENLEKQLDDGTDASGHQLADMIERVRERATLSLVDPRFGIGDAGRLVETLAERARLTPSIVLRAVCMGDLAFFEAAMAHITKLPLLNVQILANDEGRRGLQALWDKAKMPRNMLPVLVAAVEVADEVEYDGRPHDRERYRRRVLERALTRCEGAGISIEGVDADGLEYLLTKLSQFSGRDTVGMR